MKREVIAVIGKTGNGKSLFSKMLTAATRRLFAYCPAASYPVTYLDTDQLCSWLDTNPTPYQPVRIGTFLPFDVDILSDTAFVAGNCTLLLEECHTIFKSRSPLPPWAGNQVFYGRHRACTLILVSQRAASIPIDVRSQISRVVSFLQTERDDIDWLDAWFTREQRDAVTKLSEFECLDYWNGKTARYSIKSQAEKFLGKSLDTPAESMIDIGAHDVSAHYQSDPDEVGE